MLTAISIIHELFVEREGRRYKLTIKMHVKMCTLELKNQYLFYMEH